MISHEPSSKHSPHYMPALCCIKVGILASVNVLIGKPMILWGGWDALMLTRIATFVEAERDSWPCRGKLRVLC
jgi:hypothetical protein